MQAIVYTSSTGFTKRYAEALAGKTGLPCYTLEAALGKLTANDNIIYLGWLMAGGIKGLNKARRKFGIMAVAYVGMQAEHDGIEKEAMERYRMPNTPFFYLRGGYRPDQTHGLSKISMNIISKAVNAAVKKEENPSPEKIEAAESFKNGGDFWHEDYLNPVIDWYNSHNN